jgi:hypothetical protein
MPQRRKTEIVQVNLRLREELRQRLSREAEKSGRSFNQELVHRLEESFRVESLEKVMERGMVEVTTATEGAVGKMLEMYLKDLTETKK